MKKASTLTIALLLAGIATPGVAQTTPAPAATVPGVSATTSNPNLAVASIKLDSGMRLSKIIGATVYGDSSKDLGKIDDLVITKGDQVTLAVVSVGGFLGVGSKLVAFPFKQLTMDGDRVTLPGVTADTLTAMPSFVY